MDIQEEKIRYLHGSPLGIRIYSVRHYRPHFHPHTLELLYCLEGQVSIVAGHQRVSLSRGEIFTVDCTDIHFLYADGENLLVSLYIDLTRVKVSWETLRYVFFACETMKYRDYQIAPMREVQDILLALAFHYSSGEKKEAPVYSRTADRLIDILLRYFDWFNYLNPYPDSNEQTRERFHRISAYCQKNYMNKITISQLAKAEYINENYFSQFLKKTTFQGFSPMLNYLRCFEAERLILTTDLPAAEISQRCGFSDPKYYYRHFRKWFEHTPKEYRDRYRQDTEIPASFREYAPQEAFSKIEAYLARYHTEGIL